MVIRASYIQRANFIVSQNNHLRGKFASGNCKHTVNCADGVKFESLGFFNKQLTAEQPRGFPLKQQTGSSSPGTILWENQQCNSYRPNWHKWILSNCIGLQGTNGTVVARAEEKTHPFKSEAVCSSYTG